MLQSISKLIRQSNQELWSLVEQQSWAPESNTLSWIWNINCAGFQKLFIIKNAANNFLLNILLLIKYSLFMFTQAWILTRISVQNLRTSQARYRNIAQEKQARHVFLEKLKVK